MDQGLGKPSEIQPGPVGQGFWHPGRLSWADLGIVAALPSPGGAGALFSLQLICTLQTALTWQGLCLTLRTESLFTHKSTREAKESWIRPWPVFVAQAGGA